MVGKEEKLKNADAADVARVYNSCRAGLFFADGRCVSN